MKKRILSAALCTLCALALLASVILTHAHLTRHDLVLSHYRVSSPKITSPLRILQLSDLHNAQFGEGSADLLRMVREQSPDLILLTGDLVSQDQETTAVATDLIRSLSQIAPVYASLGNHELEHQDRFGTDFSALYTDAGAAVLEQDFADLELAGQAFRLGGLFGYCLPESGEADADECAFLTSFQDTDRLTILMSHMPVCWMINGSLDAWQVDIVFAGHTHGGQIILPLIGGVYGPDLGFFPGEMAGLYHSEDQTRTLVLSRGLGSSVPVPRVNNPPEILVADIVPEKE